MKKNYIVVLLVLMIFTNITNAQQVEENKLKTKYSIANKIIRSEMRNREIFIPDELQRYADLLSEDFAKKIDARKLEILPLSEINNIDDYNVFRTVSDGEHSSAFDYFFTNNTYVEYNNKIYEMYYEFNKLMKAEGTKADSSNALKIAEKFIRFNLCGDIRIDSIEFMKRKNLNNVSNDCSNDYFNVEAFSSSDSPSFPYKIQWNFKFDWERGELTYFVARILEQSVQNFYLLPLPQVIGQEKKIKNITSDLLKSY